MKVIESNLPGVLIIYPDIFEDNRGLLMETWNHKRYGEMGIDMDFVQHNFSVSKRGVLRGLHFQEPNSQGKLISVLQGEVFDVAVDIRVGSPTFKQWVGVTLSNKNTQQLYIPEGFAHGFCVVSDSAWLSYQCTDYYNPHTEHGIRWDDPEIGIAWPISEPILSDKDRECQSIQELPRPWLPVYVGKQS